MNRCDYEKKVIRKTFLNEWLNFYLQNANIENIFPKVHFFIVALVVFIYPLKIVKYATCVSAFTYYQKCEQNWS